MRGRGQREAATPFRIAIKWLEQNLSRKRYRIELCVDKTALHSLADQTSIILPCANYHHGTKRFASAADDIAYITHSSSHS